MVDVIKQYGFSFEDVYNWLVIYNNVDNKITKTKLKKLIILLFIPIVKKIAYSFSLKSNENTDDLTQVGFIGLIKAIEQYDIKKGNNFKPYATNFINGEIKHYFRDNSNMIKVPRMVKELSVKINKTINEYENKYSKTPTDNEIANLLNVTEEQVKECKDSQNTNNITSINSTNDNNENSFSLLERIEDESQKELLQSYENRTLIEDAVQQLDKIEQDVINLHFYEDLTSEEISFRLNISKKVATLRLQEALKKLSEILSND